MKLVNILLAALAIGFLAAAPASATPLVEGKHYVRVQMPQPTAVPAGKVEVIEFFWYGCSHCADFEPLLQSWVKKLPADVSFRKVPAIFNETWAAGARLYYTLDAMGLSEKLTPAVFNAMVKQRTRLNEDAVLFDWISKQGVDRQKFADMYRSFAIDGKVRKAAEMTQEYGFGGVPAVVVGGKYMPAPSLGSFGDMLDVIDGLVAKNRAEIRK